MSKPNDMGDNRLPPRPTEPWWQSAIDLLLPPRCVSCGRRGAEVCETCFQTIHRLGPGICPRCSGPSTEGRLCRSCIRRSGQVNAIIAGHAYDGAVRAAILAFKYRGRTRLEPLLSRLLADSLQRRPLTIDVVIPVPLSSARHRERGFNQAELLARPVALENDWRLEMRALIRERDTRQQTRLSAAERFNNVAGAFSVTHPSMVGGRRILLVDDVCTTGATLQACAVPLISAGASGVWGLVVAREA